MMKCLDCEDAQGDMKKLITLYGAFIAGMFALMIVDGEVDITTVLGFITAIIIVINNIFIKE